VVLATFSFLSTAFKFSYLFTYLKLTYNAVQQNRWKCSTSQLTTISALRYQHWYPTKQILQLKHTQLKSRQPVATFYVHILSSKY